MRLPLGVSTITFMHLLLSKGFRRSINFFIALNPSGVRLVDHLSPQLSPKHQHLPFGAPPLVDSCFRVRACAGERIYIIVVSFPRLIELFVVRDNPPSRANCSIKTTLSPLLSASIRKSKSLCSMKRLSEMREERVKTAGSQSGPNSNTSQKSLSASGC